ncbi:hypothetical protein CAJAP_02096 [Camponotus japonicus]
MYNTRDWLISLWIRIFIRNSTFGRISSGEKKGLFDVCDSSSLACHCLLRARVSGEIRWPRATVMTVRGDRVPKSITDDQYIAAD